MVGGYTITEKQQGICVFNLAKIVRSFCLEVEIRVVTRVERKAAMLLNNISCECGNSFKPTISLKKGGDCT